MPPAPDPGPTEPPDPVSDPSEVTRLLQAVERGEAGSSDQLLERVYRELRVLAGRVHAGEREGHTLQPTALVHEAWLRLAGADLAYRSRLHFFRVAARAMRRILVEHARARSREKRGAGQAHAELPSGLAAPADAPRPADVLAVDRALEKLEALSERQARIVELRFFGELTMDEIAEALELSKRTVEREWRFARAWLEVTLRDEEPSR